MNKWGLGIEHEMRVRFKKNISELPKNIQNTLFSNMKNEYIFLDSNTLLYYFRLHEIIIMKDFEKYASTEDEKIYLKNILLKNNLLEMAKNKIKFPIEDKNYFDIDNGKTKIDNSIKFLSFYLNIYTLYHAPLLFFTYNFNNEITLNLNIFLGYNKIIETIYNESCVENVKNLEKNMKNMENIKNTSIYSSIFSGGNESSVVNLIKNTLDNIYNDTYEKETFNYFKKLFEKKSIKDFVFSNINTNQINIDIIYGENNNFDIDKFFTKIDKYINTIKNIFNKNNFKIEGIDGYKFYKNLYVLYNNEIPEIDSTYETKAIEFKTINYDTNNYEKTLNDLIELEKNFFYIVNNIPVIKDLNDIFGELTYHNIGSVKDSISIHDIVNINYYTLKEDYTGSYHVWITAPYSNNTTMKRFMNIHSTLANKLQLLEPILAAHYSSPSYNAIDNNTNSKSSLRQFLNGYSNYGTTDVSLINGSKKHVISNYYLSENDILDKNPTISPYSNSEVPYQSYIYDMKGNLIINYDKLNSRDITNNLFKLINKGNEESENINIQNYYSLIFEKTKIRPKTTHTNMKLKYLKLGSDIRTRNLSSYIYPLDKDWSKRLLMKKNKLYEVYYNEKLNKISYERVYDKNIYKNNLLNRIGIEFRIFDHFPINYLNQFLALLVPIVLDSVKNPKIIKFKNTYVAKQFWHDEMFNVMTKGYEYTLGKQYINILEKEFNIIIEDKKLINSEMILNILYNNLCKKHHKGYKNSLYNKMRFTSKIKFINFNKKAWFEIINKYFEDNPQKLREILYHNKELENNNILEILGKKYDYNLGKIKNYLTSFNK